MTDKPESKLPEWMTEMFGEPISIYTREQAIEDGVLVDVTEWGSATKGFIGGYNAPVAMTRNLWSTVNIESTCPVCDGEGHCIVPCVGCNSKGVVTENDSLESTRGRAHDVLWMSSLAARTAIRRDRDRADFKVLMTERGKGRAKTLVLRVVLDGDGVTIGFPEDF